MRAAVFASVLACGALAAGPALAGPSSAVFANADGSISGNVVLVVHTSGGTDRFDDVASGNYDQTGAHTPSNGYYLAGVCGSSDACLGNDLASRDFFTFDLGSIPGTITSATLKLYNPGATVLPGSGLPVAPGYISDTASLSYMLYQVATASTKVDDSTQSLKIYHDLGAGVLLGTVQVSAADDGEFVNIKLDSRALADIADGGEFTLGGAVLVPVPEPAALSLLGLGLLGLGLVRRRAK